MLGIKYERQLVPNNYLHTCSQLSHSHVIKKWYWNKMCNEYGAGLIEGNKNGQYSQYQQQSVELKLIHITMETIQLLLQAVAE